jgi:DNA-binding XRE family transcriptional regulator
MPNIAAALKTEIARIARKEIRGEVSTLKSAANQQRAKIAALRKEVERLERELKAAKQGPSKAGVQSPLGTDGVALRFRASGLASHRKRLGLSAADFGRLIGVSGQSIYKWEAGEAKPRKKQLESIAAVRGIGRREALERLEAAE